MGITHSKVSTRPPSGDPEEISRDDWNDEHVVDGDFGGGIDFDQANIGGSLSVQTSTFGPISRLLMNTDPDAPDDPFDGVTGGAIAISDGWDGDDIRMEAFGGNGIVLRAYEDGGVQLINVGDNFAQLSLQSDGALYGDAQRVVLASEVAGVVVAAQGGGIVPGFRVNAANDTEVSYLLMAWGDTDHNPRVSDRTTLVLDDGYHELGVYLVTAADKPIKVEVDETATLVLNDTDAGYDATLRGQTANGVNIQAGASGPGIVVDPDGVSLFALGSGDSVQALGQTVTLSVADVATLMLHDVGAGRDATLVSAGGNGIRVGSDASVEVVAAEVYVAAVGETENINLGTAGIELAGVASHALLDSSGTWIGYSGTEPLGFYGETPVVRPTVTGSRGGNAALASLLTALADLGLIVDSTS